MSYKIAVATTDGIHVDGHFGSIESFLIYEIHDDGNYELIQERTVPGIDTELSVNCSSEGGCGKGSDAHILCSGKEGSNGGCGGHSSSYLDARVSLISDCRCLLCYKAGAGAERILGLKAISTFQLEYEIHGALAKISDYYKKVDHHISLAKRSI